MGDGVSPGGWVTRGGLAVAVTLGPACTSEPRLTVLAAASLDESLSEVAAAWVAAGHANPELAFDATSRLAKQVEAGAPADLVVAADEAWMDWLAARSLVDPGTRVDLLRNELVVVVPARSALVVSSAADLAGPEVRRLALAGESVPAGRYARAALGSEGVWDAVEARVVSGDDVRTALAWVARGEADAGLVYRTDALVEPRVRVAWTAPATSHPPIVYPAAVASGARHAAEAAAFLAFCGSEPGLAIFASRGFAPAVAP